MLIIAKKDERKALGGGNSWFCLQLSKTQDLRVKIDKKYTFEIKFELFRFKWSF